MIHINRYMLRSLMLITSFALAWGQDEFNVLSPPIVSRADLSSFAMLQSCPTGFPYPSSAYGGKICYTQKKYADAGLGPCASWCTFDPNVGNGGGCFAFQQMCNSASRNKLWLPLGDSITWGCGTDALPGSGPVCVDDAGGYRVPLALSLTQRGFNVTTMGTLSTGPAEIPKQWTQHEGHPGWCINQVDPIPAQSLATSKQPPDLITIHLGTNDCAQISNQTIAPGILKSRMESLLGNIYNRAPNASVYLASIIASGAHSFESCIIGFNELVPTIVKEWQEKGMQITFVPMFELSGLCSADPRLAGYCCRNVHPTAAGYLQMASVFALSMEEMTVWDNMTQFREPAFSRRLV